MQEERLDVITVGRSSVDLYAQQVGTPLEDADTFKKSVGGCPSNIAIGCRRLGLRSGVLTVVGDEPLGRFILAQFDREGVDTSRVRVDPERLSALAVLSVAGTSRFPLVFYREKCADMSLSEDDIDQAYVASAQSLVVTGTHFSQPGTAAAQDKAIAAARSAATKVILDIDYRPNLWGVGRHGDGESRYVASRAVTECLTARLPLCDVIVGTEEEFAIAGGATDLIEALKAVRKLSGALLVLKRGALGCVVFDGDIPRSIDDGIVVHGFPIEVCNVLGAGDAFISGFLRGYLRGEPLEHCCLLGNAAGAITVSRLMCSSEIPSYEELVHFIERSSTTNAIRRDKELSHLHWATIRRAAARSPSVTGGLSETRMLPSPEGGGGPPPRRPETPPPRRGV
jgi:5-dehydro-2-deoxygluconokinase